MIMIYMITSRLCTQYPGKSLPPEKTSDAARPGSRSLLALVPYIKVCPKSHNLKLTTPSPKLTP